MADSIINPDDIISSEGLQRLRDMVKLVEEGKMAYAEFLSEKKRALEGMRGKTGGAKEFDDTTQAVGGAKQALSEYQKLQKEEIRLNEQLEIQDTELAKSVRELREQKKELNKVGRMEARFTKGLLNSYGRLERVIKQNTKKYQDLATKKALGLKLNKREEKSLVILEKRLKKYQGVLSTVDKKIGNYRRNVGNYGSAYDGLAFSINQVTREAPAFVNNLQTGFIAISNNLPILSDEIGRLVQANKALQAAGEPTQSVLGRIFKSVFSLQTLLSLGVTLLTIYGAKLFEWAKGGKAADEASKKLEERTKKLNDRISDETAELDVLIIRLKDTKTASSERQKILDEINSKYGTTLKNLKDEAEFARQVAQAYNDIVRAIETRVTIDAFKDDLSENISLTRKQADVVNDLRDEYEKLNDELERSSGVGEIITGGESSGSSVDRAVLRAGDVKAAKKAYDDAFLKLTDLLNDRQVLKDDIARLLKELDAIGLKTGGGTTGGGGGSTKSVDPNQDLKDRLRRQKELLSVQQKGSQQEAILKESILRLERDLALAEAKTDEDRLVALEVYKAKLEQLQKFELTGPGKGKKLIDLTLGTVDEFDEDLKRREEAFKRAIDRLRQLSNEFTNTMVANSKRREDAARREVQQVTSRISSLEQAARDGNLREEESLKLEKERQRKRNAEIEREQRKQRIYQVVGAGLNTYTAKLQANQGNSTQAAAETLLDMNFLVNALSKLGSFYEGTDNTGTGGMVRDKDGRIVKGVVHENEMVVDEKELSHWKKHGVTTRQHVREKLTKLDEYESGKTLSGGRGGKQVVGELQRIRQGITQLKNDVNFDYDSMADAFVKTAHESNRVSRKITKRSGIFWNGDQRSR